jgi:hypothetical protein
VALKHQQIKSKADYINNDILNVLKYIFNIQLIIKLQSDISVYKNHKILSCVEVLHVNVGFFSAQLKCTANGISMQNVNVLPNIYGHIFEIPLHIA